MTARPLLTPLVPLYRLGLALRDLRLRRGWEKVQQLRDPVLSIGNLSAGGSGKTPLTIALAQALTRRGIFVDVLSRGYGRHSRAALRVDPAGPAELYGDEPLLIARNAGVPVYVGRQRYQAGLLAESESAAASATLKAPSPRRVHLLDDGFQHRQLARDVDIVLLSRADWRDRLLPAGNLREPIAAARRASLLVLPAADAGFEEELRAWGWAGPIWHVRRHMDVPAVEGPVVAFCGIARPRQFFAGIERAGVALRVAICYPDHHRFTERNLQSLVLAARSQGARVLLTTEKDEVRLGLLARQLPPDLSLRTVGLRLEIEDEADSLDALLRQLSAQRAHLPL